MQGRLTRDRNYRALAGRTLIGQGLGTLAGIAAALAGAGAWSLVAQQAVTATAGALALLVRGALAPPRRHGVGAAASGGRFANCWRSGCR